MPSGQENRSLLKNALEGNLFFFKTCPKYEERDQMLAKNTKKLSKCRILLKK